MAPTPARVDSKPGRDQPPSSRLKTERGPVMLKTTVVGSYPKPLWLSNPFGAFFGGWRLEAKVLREGQDDATVLAIGDQERAGIDVISDGEQRRDNFVFYFTRRLKG